MKGSGNGDRENEDGIVCEKKKEEKEEEDNSPARAGVDLVTDIEAAHVVRDVRVEVKQRGSGARDHFRHAPYVVAIFVHQSGEDGNQRRLDAVTVVNVHVVPAAFCRELLHVHPYRGVWVALDQPGTLYVRRVVADTIVNVSCWFRQSANDNKILESIRSYPR